MQCRSQNILPMRVSVKIFAPLSGIRLDDGEPLQGGKSLIMVFVNAAAYARTFGSSGCAVGVIELYGGP